MHRLILAVVLVGVSVAGALAGVALRSAREPIHDPVTQSASAPVVPLCAELARIPATAEPSLTTTPDRDGAVTVRSAEGGWSLRVPDSWTVTPQTFIGGFGGALMTSYALSPGIGPPPGSASLTTEIWTNPGHEDAVAFAARIPLFPGTTLSVDPVRIAGRSAARIVVDDSLAPQPAGFPAATARASWIVPTLHPERMLILKGWPASGPMTATVDSIVGSLQLSAPVPARGPLIYPRDDVIRPWLYDDRGLLVGGRRAEAKLVTFAQASTQVRGPRLLLRIDEDPGNLVWLVAVSGSGIPDRVGQPHGALAGQLPPSRWFVYLTGATNDGYEPQSFWTRYSSEGDWPQGFDALPDRCR